MDTTAIVASIFRCTGSQSLAVQLYPECGIVDIHLDRDHHFSKECPPETCVIQKIGLFDLRKRAFLGCQLLDPREVVSGSHHHHKDQNKKRRMPMKWLFSKN